MNNVKLINMSLSFLMTLGLFLITDYTEAKPCSTDTYCTVDKLKDASALTIDVKSMKKLRNKIGGMRISQNGNYILYSTLGNVQIIDTETLNTIKQFKTNEMKGIPIWSPDSKKVAYSSYDNSFYILSINSHKIIKLSQDMGDIFSLINASEMFWYSESEIYFINHDRYYSINLNTLESRPLIEQKFGLVNPLNKTAKQKQAQKEKENKHQKNELKKLFSQQRHKNSYIYNKSGSLIIQDKNGAYGRVLIEGVRTDRVSYYNYDDSPYLRYIIFNKQDGFFIAFLGLRDAPKTIWRADFDKTKLLNDKQKQKFEKYFKGGTLDGYFDMPQTFVIWGDIYGPQVNPLNNKVIGPNRDNYKGKVMFTESNDSYSIVKMRFERKPIKEGDIITDIGSDYIKGRFFELPSKIWAVLKK